ncbi:FAD-binding oxidoreductase [Actinomadura decatromicini]|uniref:FAD-binding oxidoreductase n=1 Tax=Actinomadura decatromicini TaxID=2604572 RepID=A0A5D3FTJ0_9ACTN|nr:FAD-binding oxidoreductase [Actinomadura decatromicini]TYK51573.1 FAD-binding oxidoreductase [Actinomadura decatromicini]
MRDSSLRTQDKTFSGTGVDWDALRRRMRGKLLRPGDPGFDDARKLFNTLTDDHIPAAVAQCATVNDVREAVSAARNRIPIAARGGGHSYVGYSAPHGGLVIDMRRLSTVDVLKDDTAIIGSGAVLGDVYRKLARAKRCLPAGSCFTVGIAGLTLGGGLGVLQRNFGLTCDHLDGVEIVTADGAVRMATPVHEPDLFWALRGGGGGNLGVVTRFIFSTVPAPALTVFRLTFPAGEVRVSKVLSAWQRWISAAPRKMWATFVITSGDSPKCRVSGCFVGPRDTCNALVDDLVERSGVQPERRSVLKKDYLGAMKYFADGTARETFVGSSRILDAPAADPKALVKVFTGRKGISLILDPLGGAVADLRADETAFPYRKAFATAQIYAGTTPGNQNRTRRSVAEVVAKMGALGIGKGHVNYIDPALPDWPKAYYGSNLAKLRSVARTYDPDKVFDFPQGLTRV